MTELSEIGVALKIAADETNDSNDHDELHAAAEIAFMLDGEHFDMNYIDRWLEGLYSKFG